MVASLSFPSTSSTPPQGSETRKYSIQVHRHYSRFEEFLSKIGMHVKTVQIELFAVEIIISIHISSFKKVLPKYEN